MKSKAQVKGHPLHPILIAFPVAFLTGALAFDAFSLITGNAGYWQTGKYLEICGIVTALIAAVPGTIDYLYTVPPNSSAKKRATQHMLVNILMVAAFTVAFFIRDDRQQNLIIIIEAIGALLLVTAGWMGGTLVHRNQIGVDPRYANAGKWKEAYLTATGSAPIEAALIDELEVDQMKLLHIAGKRIVLGRTENGYVAFDDRCSHKGGSLAGGMMICGTVQCPWHGSQFDCSTGKVKAGPATEGIATYTISEHDGKVLLTL